MKKKWGLSKIAVKGLKWFFICMIAFTIISRRAALLTIPKVTLGTAASATLTREISGTGVIDSEKDIFMEVKAGYKVAQVYVEEGAKVKKGQKLFRYNLGKIEEEADALEEEITDLEDQAKKAELEIERAEIQIEQEKKQKVIGDGEVNKEIAQVDKNSAYRKLEEKEKSLSEINKVVNTKGIVCATKKGTLTSMEVTAGNTTTGEELVSISSGGFLYKGKVTEEQAKCLNKKDAISISYKLDEPPIETTISNIGSAGEDGTVEIKAKLPDGDYVIDRSASFTIEQTIGDFYNCVPMEALRVENGEKYVLLVEEKEGIMGTEYVAKKLHVTVQAQSETLVAIEEGIGSDQPVIIGYNKEVQDGDRVRY